MWAFIMMIFSYIVKALMAVKDVVGPALSSIWSGATKIGGAIADWYADEKIPASAKIAATLGAGYVLLPNTTSSLVDRVVDGAADTTSTVLSGIASVITKNWLPIVIGVGVWYFMRPKQSTPVVVTSVPSAPVYPGGAA